MDTITKTPNSKAVPYRFWRDPNGKTYSFFTSWKPEGSVLVEEGWTVSHQDGTTGLGRKPFDTQAEAEAWCKANPNFSGMGRMGD